MLSPFLKSLLQTSGVFALLRATAGRSRGVVLRYHSVSDGVDRTDRYLDHSLTVSTRVFERQIHFLSRRYTIVPLEDMVNRLRRGQKLFRRAIAITFDDGYRDNYTRAFPILHRYQAPATFYLTTGCIENRQVLWTAYLRYLLTVTQVKELRLVQPEALCLDLTPPGAREEAFTILVVRMKNIPTAQRQDMLAAVAAQLQVSDLSPLQDIMMSWAEVREMQSQGMSFGAHTITHPNLPNTPSAEAEQEIYGSKTAIEEQIKEPVLHFSYPNGRGSSHLTAQVKAIVQRVGFASAVTSFAGCIQPGDDLFALKRVGVYKKHGRLCNLSWEIERHRWQG